MDHPLIATAARTCHALPEQWEGQLTDDQHFYYRYRWGRATLGIGPNPDAAVEDPNEVSIQHGEDYDGEFVNATDRQAVFAVLLDQRIEKEVSRG